MKTVCFADFLNAASYLFRENWKPNLINPTKAFYNLCRAEIIRNESKESKEIFANIKYNMVGQWDIEIVKTSSEFKKAKKFK